MAEQERKEWILNVTKKPGFFKRIGRNQSKLENTLFSFRNNLLNVIPNLANIEINRVDKWQYGLKITPFYGYDQSKILNLLTRNGYAIR